MSLTLLCQNKANLQSSSLSCYKLSTLWTLSWNHCNGISPISVKPRCSSSLLPQWLADKRNYLPLCKPYSIGWWQVLISYPAHLQNLNYFMDKGQKLNDIPKFFSFSFLTLMPQHFDVEDPTKEPDVFQQSHCIKTATLLRTFQTQHKRD